MTTFDAGAALLGLAAVIGLVNDRWIGIPRNIALLIGALVAAGLLILVSEIRTDGAGVEMGRARLEHANLSGVLLDGVLALMLFAGSQHVALRDLRAQAWPVLLLATVGVVVSAALFGTGLWLLCGWVGLPIPLIWCLVLGTVVAPTDAVVVETLLRPVRMPARLRGMIAGESLFNDGAAVVLFLAALAIARGESGVIGHGHLMLSIAKEVIGGGLMGWSAGWAVRFLERGLRDGSLRLTLSLALALGIYRAALEIGVSGPIAVVAAGLAYHNAPLPSRAQAENLATPWAAVDDVLNTLLFLLMGFQLVAIRPSAELLLLLPFAFGLAVLTRGASVGLTLAALRLPVRERLRGVAVLTWTGLRGGISVALALTLPDTPYRGPLLAVGYAVVIMTIVIQGLSLPAVLARLYPPEPPHPAPARPD